MRVLHLDVETRSTLPLDRVSTRRYAADETTEVLCAAYAIDDGPIELWVPGAPIPGAFIEIAIDPEWCLTAHNANFEFSILRYLLAPRFGWPSIPINRFVCTMARARCAALPGSLDGAAAALGLDVRKDKSGAKLMREIAARKREPTPQDLERLHAYCRQDVEVERELFRRLPQLTEAEQALWVLDHEINHRGIPIDRDLAVAIDALAKKQRLAINAEIAALTGGQVTTANQRDRIVKYLKANGYEIAGLTKTHVKEALANGLDDSARTLLELRSIGSQTAPAKVKPLLEGMDDDDRVRETLVFHGSAPGRWSGRKFQPQNLKKANKTLDVNTAIAAIKSGELARVEALGPPLSIVADVSRALICARPGYVLIGADFSAIESRVLAWLAGERWKLDAYRRFDETGDPALEPYCQIASKILGHTVTPDDNDGRDLGKVADLAGGFGGSVGAWRRFAPKDTRDDAAIKADINAFRQAHPRTTRFWNDLDLALKRAVRRPRKPFTCGCLTAQCRDGTLWLTLPSGRSIAYPEARLVDGKYEDSVDIAFKDNAHGKWKEITEWCGTFVKNAVQATARDLLAAALIRLEAANFPIIAHVHDEVVSEIPEGEDRTAEFVKIMTIVPAWAEGLPIAGKPWCGRRFIKSDKPDTPPDISAEEIPTQTRESEPMPDQDPPWEGNGYAHNANTDRDADMTLAEQLHAHEIDLTDVSPGRHYTTCPKCSLERKPQHQDLKVLGVTMTLNNAHWGCNHCGWTGRAGKANDRNATTYYDYTDEDGVLLFQKVRCPGGSKFFLRRPDGKGGWINKLEGVRKVIYRLPQIRKAIATRQKIVCVEGEKDAETLWSAGIVATTSPDGAAKPGQRPKWRPEYSQMLIGADLIVMGDNDDAGRAHVEATASMSLGIAARVRTLDFAKHWPACPKGGDVSDWQATEKGTGQQLEAILAQAVDLAQGDTELESICAAEVTMNAVTWWWPNRFALGKLGILAGLPDEGKGLIFCFMAAKVTTAGSWPMSEGNAPLGNVVYLQSEDGIKDP
jgi:hypothetical protein